MCFLVPNKSLSSTDGKKRHESLQKRERKVQVLKKSEIVQFELKRRGRGARGPDPGESAPVTEVAAHICLRPGRNMSPAIVCHSVSK